MASELVFERDGVRLAGMDFGGEGPSVLLLHGLAGYAGEWADTASWLSERARVVTLDARGHGNSERFPADVSRAAHVADAAFAVERLELAPIVVVGQSLGGLTALLLAAERPDLVQALVMVEARPHGGGEDADADAAHVAAMGEALRRWPVPFPSRDAAVEHFGGPSLTGNAWADGLERRDDGWWPRFDVDVMMHTLAEADSRSYWQQWESIACPVLVVRGGDGSLPREDAEAMVSRARDARLADVPGAEHDLHLDHPAEWREALTAFLDSLTA
jgi:pimeloyl-ACP methyl ester carboxylesterase